MGHTHPRQRLTALRVRTEKAGIYADGNGLYLVVDASGARRWLLRTLVGGRRRHVGLGSCRLVSLADARTAAARLRAIARAGGDPVAEQRRRRRVAMTFAESARAVHKAHAPTFRNLSHRAWWLSSLEKYAFPQFGDRPIDQVDSADVLKVLTPIWHAKPETARRVKQRIKLVFEWAEAAGHRDGVNPVDRLKRALPSVRHTKRHMRAVPYRQVPAFLEQLRASPSALSVRLALEWLVLTATRTGETIGARWDEIDRAGAMWTIPAVRIKSNRPHRVPLSPAAIAILDQAAAIPGGSAFVFPGRRATLPLSNMALLMAMRRLGQSATVHGFRSSFRDWAAERTTFAREVAEAALAHVVENPVEAAYRRTDYFELRRSLMATWAAFVTTPAGSVVTLRAPAAG